MLDRHPTMLQVFYCWLPARSSPFTAALFLCSSFSNSTNRLALACVNAFTSVTRFGPLVKICNCLFSSSCSFQRHQVLKLGKDQSKQEVRVIAISDRRVYTCLPGANASRLQPIRHIDLGFISSITCSTVSNEIGIYFFRITLNSSCNPQFNFIPLII